MSRLSYTDAADSKSGLADERTWRIGEPSIR
jgi:hypothetical protein